MKNELLRNYDYPAKWHELKPGVRLCIKLAPFLGTIDGGNIGRESGHSAGKRTGQTMPIGDAEAIFQYSLVAWEGIEVQGTPDEARAILFRNNEVRRFVLLKATGRTFK